MNHSLLTIYLLTFLTAFLSSFVHNSHRSRPSFIILCMSLCLHYPAYLSLRQKLYHLRASCLISATVMMSPSSTRILRDFSIVVSSSRTRTYVAISHHVAPFSTIAPQSCSSVIKFYICGYLYIKDVASLSVTGVTNFIYDICSHYIIYNPLTVSSSTHVQRERDFLT